MMLTSKAAFRETFGSIRWREGYEFQQVDTFIDEVVETLRAWESDDRAGDAQLPEEAWPRVRVSSQDVVNKMFRATRFKDGYEQEDVDLFLDDVVETLRHYELAAAS